MIKQTESDHARVRDRLRDLKGVEEALALAVRQARLEHARAGRKVPVWKDGEVVWESLELEELAGKEKPKH